MCLIFNLQLHPKCVNLDVPWEFTAHSNFNADKMLLINCLPAFIFKFVFLQERRKVWAGPLELFVCPRGAQHLGCRSPSPGADFRAAVGSGLGRRMQHLARFSLSSTDFPSAWEGRRRPVPGDCGCWMSGGRLGLLSPPSL